MQEECDRKKIWESNLESQIAFFRDIDVYAMESVRDSVEEINSTIYNKYLKKEYEELTETHCLDIDKIPMEKIQKFDKLYDLMEMSQFFGAEEFKEQYEAFNEKVFLSTCLIAKEEIETDTLSVEKLEKLVQLATSRQDDTLFFEYISRLMSPDNPKIVENLLIRLFESGELSELNKYSVVKAKATDTEIIAYQKEGKIVMTESYWTDECDVKEAFDFTMENGEDKQKIINDFLILKQQVTTKNPNAIIKIQERLITVDNEDNQECYLIENGQILPTKIIPVEEINFKLKEEHEPEKIELPIVVKKNPFERLIDSLKMNFQKKIINESGLYEAKPIISKRSAFKNQISDISSFDTKTNLPKNITQNKVKDADKEL